MSKSLRLGVLSDTHGSRSAIEQALQALGPVDIILHAGDYVMDARWIAKQGYEVVYVRGNCDLDPYAEDECLLNLRGYKVLLTHGHEYGVKYHMDALAEHAEAVGANVCIFGHSHRSACSFLYGCLMLNPGSPSLPRGCAPSCAILTLEEGKAPQAEIVPLIQP